MRSIALPSSLRASLMDQRLIGNTCSEVSKHTADSRMASRPAPLERPLQTLLADEGLLPAIARLREPLRRIGDREFQRMCRGELLPGKRHRDRRTGGPARRIGDVQGLAANV